MRIPLFRTATVLAAMFTASAALAHPSVLKASPAPEGSEARV